MRFTGNIDAKTDAKGRIFLPAVFRKILQANGEEKIILRRDVFQKCLVLYPASIWDQQVDAVTARTNMFSLKGRDILRRFVAGAQSIVLDGNGRMLIQKEDLKFCGIDSDVRFIGVDNTIELWNRDAAEALLNDADDFASSLEALMSTQQDSTSNPE